MADRSPILARSWEDLQQHISSIVDRLNDDPALARAAAANAFLALEELGYVVPAESRPLIEDRLRFSPADAARRRRLREQIFALAGMEFDLNSPEALYDVLFKCLGIRPYPDARGCTPPFPDTHRLRWRVSGAAASDPLEVLRGRHDVIQPLLEYRKLDASQAPLAPAAAYLAIRRGERASAVRALRIHLKGQRDEERERVLAPEPVGPPTPPAPEQPDVPLDVNTASAAELELLPGVGLELARRIVNYREAHGPFASPNDLTKVAGIGNRLLARLRPHIRADKS